MKILMQTNATNVVRGDAGDECVVASEAAFLNQRNHQKVTDSSMTNFHSKIDCGLKGL